MKKLSFLSMIAALAFQASAAVDTSEFIDLELGKDYEVVAFKPFQGKVTAPETGQIVIYSCLPVYTLDNAGELELLSEEQRKYAGYINGKQVYQFSATKDVTYYIYDRFPMTSETLRLEMNPALKMLSSEPAVGETYDLAGNPHILLIFNQNLNIGKATVSTGNLSADVVTHSNGSSVAAEVNDALQAWYDANQLNEGDAITLTLTEVTDALGTAVDDITLSLRAAGKPYKMIDYKLPEVIYSYMPESSVATKAVFTFDGPMGENPNIQLCYSPIELGYEYYEQMEATVEGNKIIVDFAGKLRASAMMSENGVVWPDFDLRLFSIKDARGQLVSTGNNAMIGSYHLSVPYHEIPRLKIDSSFTPANGSDISGETEINIYYNNANGFTFDGISFKSGSESVVVAAADFVKNEQISESEREITVAIPQGWATKPNVEVSFSNIKCNDGYDHSDDIKAKYNGFTITFVDPAAGSRLATLAKGRTITIDTNLEAGVAVTFAISDSDGNIVYGPAEMTSRNSGSYVHTMEKKVTLYRGTDYDMVFTTADGKSESIALIGNGKEFEYSGLELISMNPADKSEIERGARIALEFSGLVVISKLEGSVDFTANNVNSAEDYNGYDTNWELVIDPEAEGEIHLIFSAPDMDNVATEGNEGEEDESHFHFTFTVSSGAIDAIKAEMLSNGIYNLKGQRLSAPVKGVNIIDGRKILVK